MMKYEVVPNVVTKNDLELLNNIFEWNYNAYKFCINALKNIRDDDVKDVFYECSNLFYNEMVYVLDTLGDEDAR